MQRKGSKKRYLKEEQNFSVSLAKVTKLQYNALTDPFAKYYFASRVAKERLKDLRHELKKQNKSKSPRKKEMINIINEKIRSEFPKIHLPLLDSKSKDEVGYEKERLLSEQLPRNIVTERARPSHKGSIIQLRQSVEHEKTASNEITVVEKLQKVGKSRKKFKQQKGSNKINHSDFLNFLQKKKEQIVLSQNN